MKIRKITSAATAVMIAAMTLVPQIPSVFSGSASDFTITAEAAENAVDVSVVDAVTGSLLPDIEVIVGPDRDTVAEGDGAYKWNTTKESFKKIVGAYNSDLYVSLRNVPEEYEYDDIYVIDNNTRTFGDYRIRLVPKNAYRNFALIFYLEGENFYSMLSTIDFNIYDKKGNWITTVRDQRGTFLPDGEYVIKADRDALRRSGFSVIGKTDTEFTVKDGIIEEDYYYDMKQSYGEKDINTRFTIKNEGDDVATSEGVGKVQIKGDKFTVISDGALYLGDGHYIAHRNSISKDPFNVFRWNGMDSRASDKLDGLIDQVMNDIEDIEFNIVDGKPDRDLVFVKKPVTAPNEEDEKSDAMITVRDNITGEDIKGIDVEVIAGINASAKTIAKWNTSDEPEKVLKDLTVNPNFKYGVILNNVPAEYSYKEEYVFDVAKGVITENWTVELEKKPEEVPQEGATATITVRDKTTGNIIKGIDVEAESGLNASTQSIGSWNTSDDGVKTITGLSGNPNVCYGFTLKNVPADYEYKDTYIFCFDEGSKKAEWLIELEKKSDVVSEKGSTARIAVRDMATGKNIEGIDVEVIAGINATGKSIAKWNTSDEAEKTLTGLTGNMQMAYGIKLTNVPEKYVHEDMYAFMRTEGTDTEDWTISLVTSDIKDNITFDMYDWSEERMYDFLGKDLPFYAKITDKDGNFCYGFNKADNRALPDGEYTFELVTPPEGYDVVMPESDTAKELQKKFLLSKIDGGIINFTMKDGKPDKEIVFDIIKKPEKEGIEFRLYSRYSGLWNENGGVGSVTIMDGKGKKVGEYDLSEKISLPDGKYTSDVFVNCKGYSCFSDPLIEFNVKDGKADRNLNYNIEVWNFNDRGNGDANGDNNIDIADSVLIMQSLANPSKYGVNGTDDRHITEEGKARADVDGEGVTNRDALTIQKYLLGFFKVN